MESWFVSDIEALQTCFGNRLREKVLPQNPDVEAVPKRDVLVKLNEAVKETPVGRYHKVQHSIKILEKLNPATVATRSKHARELHNFLRASCPP
jgi:hypothetical protein